MLDNDSMDVLRDFQRGCLKIGRLRRGQALRQFWKRTILHFTVDERETKCGVEADEI
jgi:hypothetical protein